MIKINMTCIMCPVGCGLTIEKNGGKMSVTGNNCIRGEQYAKDELVNPKRVVTALVKTTDGVLPVKTTKAVPKELIFKVVEEINKITLTKGKIGDIIISNVLNTGADVVVTGNATKYEI